MFFKKVYFIILSFFFVNCGDNYSMVEYNSSNNINLPTEIDKSDCSIEEQNRVVYEKMKNNYLWYEYMPDIDYRDYNSTESLLDDLRYRDYDRWSYITSATKYSDFYEKGVYKGFGFSIGEYNGRVFVTYVYENSPADMAGFKRGTEILEVDGKTISKMENRELWRVISRDSSSKIQFKISNDNIEYIVVLEKKPIKISSIIVDKIVSIDDKKIGYFILNGFIEPTLSELDTLFDKFKREEIDELILDMRYNGGGRVSVANYLANLIGGEITEEMPFEKLEYNNKNSSLNTTFNFSKEKNSLDLDRVFIISTDKTCSASESVINGLKPYINVNLIGSKTCGKPVGMSGVDFCEKHLAPIEFKMLNADGDGDYFSGIEPRCYVLDDIFHTLGERDESMLRETLFFIENGICSNVTKRYKIKKRDIDSSSSIFSGFQREIDAI